MRSKLFGRPKLLLTQTIIGLLFFCITVLFCRGAGSIYANNYFNTEKDSLIGTYSKTEILVKFQPTAFNKNNFISSISKLNKSYSSDVNSIFNKELVKNKKSFKKNGLDRIYKIELKPGETVQDTIKAYKKLIEVEYAEPNYIGKIFNTPDDTDFESQYHLHNTGQTGGTADADIDAPEAWDLQTGDSDIEVAILDTGVDWDHLDLVNDIWVNTGDTWSDPSDPDSGDSVDNDVNTYIDDYKGWDFVNVDDATLLSLCQAQGDDCLVRDNNPIDFNGHGTHCSGIAAAITDNNRGVAGIGWNTKIMNVRMAFDTALGGYWEADDAVAAIQYAVDTGASVISASWGTTFLDAVYESATLRAAVNYAYDNEVIFVAAAGNWPPFGSWEYSLYPAMYNNVIAVAATDDDDLKPSFSNYSSWVDVSAPGDDIWSTIFDASIGNDTYGYGSGTSMSTPVVAGIAALIKAEQPTWPHAKIINTIRTHTDDIGALNPSYKYKLGSGRINAEKVLNSSEAHTSGSIITSPSATKAYYLQGGAKRHIVDGNVYLNQFDWHDIAMIDDSELNNYPEGSHWRYPDGTLISNSGKVYVLEYQAKRWITSPSIFTGLGYRWGNIIAVSNSVANDISTGADLSATGYHPSGTIVYATGDSKVYMLDNGRKRWIANQYIYLHNYKNWDRVVTISPAELSTYPDDIDIVRRDGSLIANYTTNKVYIIEYGLKRWITSPEVFTDLGYKWSSINIVSDTELALYPDGADIS
ncbi:S8 family peptidase [Patescibacteria group bacterium]